MSAEVEQNYPKLTINMETGRVQRAIWDRPKRIDSLSTWDTLIVLARSAGQAIQEKQIHDLVVATGSHSLHPVSSAVTSLRKTLEEDPKNPSLIVTSGSSLLHSNYDIAYTLCATVELIGDPVKTEQYRQSIIQKTQNHHEVHQINTLWLPDGQAIEVKGQQQILCLQQIIYNPDPMENDALAKTLYGTDDKSARDRASAIVSALNRQLEARNWRIAQIPKPEPSQPRKKVYQLAEIKVDNSPWARARRILAANLPSYNTQYAPYTTVLQEFYDIRQRVKRGESSSLIGEFENKFGLELVDTLAPALKEITALVSSRRIW